ncbi:MAG: hypothetical protein ABL889_21880, partial [Terricaulis sp.]
VTLLPANEFELPDVSSVRMHQDESGSLIVDTDAAQETARIAFVKEGGVWIRTSIAAAATAPSSALSVRVVEATNDPPKLVASTAGRSRTLLDPNAYLQAFGLPQWRTLDWRDEDGRNWRCGLLTPESARRRRLPLIIQTHGYSSSRYLIDGPFSTAFAAQNLAAHGFAVVQLADVRTPPEQEAQIYLAAYEHLIDELHGTGVIDHDLVGLVGFSRTCFHVAHAMVFSRFPIRAVVASDGVDMGYSQYLAWLRGMSPAWPQSFEQIYGGAPFFETDGATNARAWVDEAPHFHLSRTHAALRVEVTEQDQAMLGWELFAGMRRLGLPAEYVIYNHGDHELSRPRQRRASLQGTVDWMRFWLKGEADNDPTKAGQYERWRAMRAERSDVTAQ